MGKKTAALLTPEQKAKKEKAKKDAFIRVVTPRVNKALKAIRLVGNCATSNYSYTPEQARAIVLSMQTVLQGVENVFVKKVEKVTEFKLSS
jgi:hypothetical protein